MSVVDEQGRLFGRWNVVDVLIGIVLLALIPILYGGYLLFKPATPSLTSIEPARIFERTDTDFIVHGNNLRPYMRISFNEHQGADFFFDDATRARVPLVGIPPGVYDVILYDHAQERSRIPKGLVVLAAPVPHAQLDLIGSFTGVTGPVLEQLKAGAKVESVGEIVRIGNRQPSMTRTVLGAAATIDVPSGDAVNIPAIIRASCALTQRSGQVYCTAGDLNLVEDAVLRATIGGGSALFQIDQIKLATASEPVTARVRFAGDRAALELMRIGDRDSRRRNEFAAAGEIVSLEGIRQSATSVGVVIPSAPGTMQPFVATDLAFRDATIRMDAQLNVEQWTYAGRNLSVGAVLPFTGPRYELRGTVLSIARPTKP